MSSGQAALSDLAHALYFAKTGDQKAYVKALIVEQTLDMDRQFPNLAALGERAGFLDQLALQLQQMWADVGPAGASSGLISSGNVAISHARDKYVPNAAGVANRTAYATKEQISSAKLPNGRTAGEFERGLYSLSSGERVGQVREMGAIGDTREEMAKAKDENDHFEWRIDYNSSLGDRLERYLDQLLLSVEVHRIATHKSDHLAAYLALKDVGTHARSISELFGDIKADAHKVSIFDKRFAWPDIPDDYRFPEHLVTSH